MHKKINDHNITLDNISTMSLNDKIIYSHQIREALCTAIKNANLDEGEKLIKLTYVILENTDLGILNRTDKKLRSLKNIFLSFNTLFSYHAELGGLSPIVAHYRAEKYAIILERIETIEEAWKVYFDYFYDYIDGSARMVKKSTKSISENVINYINQNFTNRITIDEIANYMHLNSAYLMRCFKKETNKTIQQMITEKRIQESCRLLATSNMTNTEISLMVGFGTPSYFTSTFKQYINLTPKDYRNHVKSHYIDRK